MTVSQADLPSHAYVPGRTARHPEGAFEAIRGTVRADMSPEEMAGSEAFQTGLRYLEKGYFWEAHEVLEPVWMALPEGSEARRVVQALIQTANACLKQKMDRPKAALRLCAIVRDLLAPCQQPEVMTVDVAELIGRIDRLEAQLQV